jgi:hypothetical protein
MIIQRYVWAICIGLGGVVLLPRMIQGQTSNSQIDPEVVAAWKAYDEFAQRLQGSKTSTYRDQLTGRMIVRKRQYCQNLAGALIRRIPVEGNHDEGEEVLVQNRQYNFEVRSTQPNVYRLVTYNPDPTAPLLLCTVPVRDAIFVDINPHYCFGYRRLWQIFDVSSNVKVQQSRRVPTPQGERYRIDFDGEYALPGDKDTRRVRGYLLLDPNRKWCIERAEYKEWSMLDGKPSYELDYVTEYFTKVHASGFPLVIREVVQSKGYSPRLERKLDRVEEKVYEIELSTDDDEAPFLLSAFGLPEPVGVVWEKKTPVYGWLLLAAGALGMLALLFRWLAQRQQRRSGG